MLRDLKLVNSHLASIGYALMDPRKEVTPRFVQIVRSDVRFKGGDALFPPCFAVADEDEARKGGGGARRRR
jgi:hypothetical protein